LYSARIAGEKSKMWPDEQSSDAPDTADRDQHRIRWDVWHGWRYPKSRLLARCRMFDACGDVLMVKSKALHHEGTKSTKEGEKILIDLLCPCECCSFNASRMNAGDGWCYMWKRKPNRCTQFEKIEGVRIEGNTLVLP